MIPASITLDDAVALAVLALCLLLAALDPRWRTTRRTW
jgi:hypothetical protein